MKLFSILQFMVGLSALAGGVALIITNGLGMPASWLSDSPFESFIFPGIILALVVGGSFLISAVSVWRNGRYALEFSAAAGFSIMIWVFTQLYLIKEAHWLQIVYFTVGIATSITVMLFLKYSSGKENGKIII